MIKHRKIPKNRINQHYNEIGSESEELRYSTSDHDILLGKEGEDFSYRTNIKSPSKHKKNMPQIFVIYRLNDDSADYLTNEDFSMSYRLHAGLEDDWCLMGALPKKNAFNYGKDENYFDLTPQATEELEKEIISYAKERLLSYLAYRERSLSECFSYLDRLPLNKTFADQLIQQFVEMNYINENRFAELLTESSISRNKSYTEAKASLFKKNIAPDIVEQVLRKYYTEETRKEVLEYHINKAIRRFSELGSYKDYRKCIAYLMKKGFPYDSFIDRIKEIYQLSP